MWPLFLPPLLLILMLVAVLTLRRRLDTAFRIDLCAGRPHLVHGDVDEQFLRDVENICNLWHIDTGTILARRTRRGLRLDCKGDQLTRYRRTFQNALENQL